MQGKNAADFDTFEELTTSHTHYHDPNNLPYLTGITTGSGQDQVWHTISATWYDGKNRITRTAQVNTDYLTYADVVDGSGHLKPYSQLAVYLTASAVTSYIYNEEWSGSPDQPYCIVDPAGGRQYFHYNTNNAQDASWTLWDDPEDVDTDPDRFVMSLALTDDQGRPICSYQLTDEVTDPLHPDPNVVNIYANLSSLIAADKAVLLSQTWYNAIGQVDVSKDAHGITTKYEYDALGQLTETLVYESYDAFQAHYPDYPADTAGLLSISQTLYDADGRVLVSVGPRDPNCPDLPTGTETVYDALGRVTETRRWPAVSITMQNVVADGAVIGRKAVGWKSNGLLPIPGSELSHTRTEYDLAGRVYRTYTQNEAGEEICTSRFVYDTSGRQIKTISLPDIPEKRSVTETVFDGSRRAAVIDARSSITEYVYDDLGRVITTVHPESIVQEGGEDPVLTYSHVGYDGLGRKVWQSEPTIHTNESEDQIDYDTVKVFEYDSAGRLSAVVLPKVEDPNNGNNWTWPRYEYEYDGSGNLILIRDKIQQLDSPFSAAPTAAYTFARQTTFTYDEHGRQTSRTLPDDRTEYKTYDNYGRLQVELDFKEQATGYFYDSRGRLAYKRYYAADNSIGDGINDNYPADPNEQIAYTYDNLGRKLSETVTVFNSAGQPIEIRQWSYGYDTDGNLTRIESPEGIINYQYSPITGQKVRTWTGQDWETRITDTTYTYDELGRLQTVTVWRRDGVDLTTPETTTYTYNAAGSRQSTELPNGVYTEYNYDPLNRLSGLTHYQSDQKTATISSFTYSLYADNMRAGAEESMQETHTISYDYDALNRLTYETNYNAQSYGYTSDYIYDIVGNRYQRQVEVTNQEDSYTLTTTYVYNEKNDQLMQEVHTGPEFAFMWDNRPLYVYADGGRLSYQFPGKEGRLSTWQAFMLGMPTSLDHLFLTILLIGLPVICILPSLRRFYRQLAGRSPPDRQPLGLYHRSMCLLFVYIFLVGPECLNMLARADGQYLNLSTSAWGSGNRTISYQYDKNGSQICKTTKKTLEDEIIEVVKYEYNLQDRLSKVITTTYSEGDPVGTETVEYRYDPDGIRTEKTVDGTTRIEYLIDPDNHTGYAQVLEESEYDVTNPASPVLLSANYYTLGDDVIAQTKAADFGSGWTQADTEYLLYDGHGSTRQLALPNKSIIDNYCYDGYGVMLGSSSSVADNAITKLLYSGEQYDSNLDQYYLRARYYNQSNGTFNRVDSYSGNIQDPQSLHKYLYCHNNPINSLDPSGKWTLCEILIVALTVGGLTLTLGPPILRLAKAVKGMFEQFYYSGFIKKLTAIGIINEMECNDICNKAFLVFHDLVKEAVGAAIEIAEEIAKQYAYSLAFAAITRAAMGGIKAGVSLFSKAKMTIRVGGEIVEQHHLVFKSALQKGFKNNVDNLFELSADAHRFKGTGLHSRIAASRFAYLQPGGRGRTMFSILNNVGRQQWLDDLGECYRWLETEWPVDYAGIHKAYKKAVDAIGGVSGLM